jgi:hypothetical protein
VQGNLATHIGNTGTAVHGLGTIATQAASSVSITGGTLAGLTGLAIRDTSAAHDVTLGATSSTTLTAARTLTLDMVDASRTVKLGGNLTVSAAATISGTNTGDQTIPTGGTPGLTLGTANTAGSSAHFLRVDDTILAFDATSPSTQAFGDSAAVGSATVAARRDHKHAMMSAPTSVTGSSGSCTGNAATASALTAQYVDWNASSGGASIAHVPSGIGVDAISVILDGNGAVLTAGMTEDLYVPYDCLVNTWVLLSTVAGAVSVAVWDSTYANFPPTSSGLLGTAVITGTAVKQASSVSWTVHAGDCLRFHVNSATNITHVTLILVVTKT